MKKTFLSAICLLPYVALAQNDFTIKGKISNPMAESIILSYRTDTKIVSDTAKVTNGLFEFKGMVQEPTQANLKVKSKMADKKSTDILSLYLENVIIDVASTDSLKYAKISGSSVNEDHSKLKNTLKSLDEQNEILMAEYGKYTIEQRKDENFMEPFEKRYEIIDKAKKAANLDFAQKNTSSFIGLIALRNWMGYDINVKLVEPEFLKMSTTLQNTKLGKNISKIIDGARLSQVGVIAKDFSQNDPDGKAVKLSDFKGKYVLVDFWASWCGPCRAENPNVVKAYEKFKNQNFTILGVSLDNPGKKEAWLKAVKDDNLTWTQVSDLQGWKNEVSNMYGVQSIPFNFLVDPEGKIIARNIRGKVLHKTLAELLK